MAHFLIHLQRQAARSAVFLFYLCNVWKFLSMWMYCNAVNLFFWAVFVDLILYECHTRSISVVHPLCMYGERSSVKQLSFLVWLFLSWSGHLQEKRSVIGWFVRNRLAFLWISVGQSKIKYVKMWRTFRTEEIQMCRLWATIWEELCSALSAMQKTMVWRGLDFSFLLSVLSLRATSTHSSTDSKKWNCVAAYLWWGEWCSRVTWSPTPCADGSVHRSWKSESIQWAPRRKPDAMCRRPSVQFLCYMQQGSCETMLSLLVQCLTL